MTRPLPAILALTLSAAPPLAGGCDRPAVVTVLGDHGTQPPTVVNPLPRGAAADADPAIASAKRAVVPSVAEIWPEPISVTERPGQWDVMFKYREKLVLVNGVQSVRAQLPSALLVVVRKPDLAAKILPGR